MVEDFVRESRIFVSYKALGLVSDHVPACLTYSGAGIRLNTAVGNVIHGYDVPKLRLLNISPQLPANVRCLTGDKCYMYAGCDRLVVIVRLGRRLEAVLKGHEDSVKFLLLFGTHLVSIDDSCRLIVWNLISRDIFCELDFDPTSFRISALCHPTTYLNKLLLASEQGSLRLLNVKTAKLVYEFAGWDCAVSAVEQSSAVDVVAVGLADGRIVLHNLRYDQTVTTFKQGTSPVRALAFRTDSAVPMLLAANDVGQLAAWDLDKSHLAFVKEAAHDGRIVTLIAVHNEPCLMTSGDDNAIKCWVFDDSLGAMRLYHSVEGHSKPPLCIRFYGADGRHIVSAAGDGKLKMFDTLTEVKNINMGIASRLKRSEAKKRRLDFERYRLPPVFSFDVAASRQRAWENLVGCHEGNPLVTAWTTNKGRIGPQRLLHKRFKVEPTLAKAKATCCALSACGNFALIGYNTGHVDVFNIQSAIYRGSLCDPTVAHSAALQGICPDGLNQFVITGCSLGELKIWHFASKRLLYKQSFPAGFKRLLLHRDNNLLAIALDDLSIVVYDSLNRCTVRQFLHCHQAAITDLAFTPGGHWLLSSSQDCTVKVWDLNSASLIDVLQFAHACKSLSVSPTGEYLATCHSERRGIFLWVNKTVYRPQVLLRPLSDDYKPASCMDLPAMEAQDEQETGQPPCSHNDDDDATAASYECPEQIEQLSSTSTLPATHWANLVDLDVISQRNKPKQAPTTSKNVPFFLHIDQQQPADGQPSPAPSTKLLAFGQSGKNSAFRRALLRCRTDQDRWLAFEKLSGLHRAAVYDEIASVCDDESDGQTAVVQFLTMLDVVLRSGRRFELANAYLAVLLATNRQALFVNPGQQVLHWLRTVQQSQQQRWRCLDQLFTDTTSMVSFIGSSVV